MMIHLKKIFPSLIRYHEKSPDISDAYQWFVTDNGEIIGIQKNELTPKDMKLLTAFLSPYNNKMPIPTKAEKYWLDLLHDDSGGNIAGDTKQTPFRFVYFSIKKNQIPAPAFKAAIHELFAEPVPILWENEHEGIMVDELKLQPDERISYEQIIDILMSDLNGAIHFYVGAYMDDLYNVKDYYTSIIQGAKSVFAYTSKSVITYAEAVPFMLMDQTEGSFKQLLASTILKEFADEEDFLHMLQTFIGCNLNITLTAKELYMHRNTLQYRLDKFQEKTGMDVREFHQAFTVYLALLANMHKE
ncbi:PucR family transcriptional regulator [Virgibacillus kimchii]